MSKQLKNYLILAVIFIATMAFTLYLSNCYKVYQNSKIEVPVIEGTLSSINNTEIQHYILENSEAVIYMCTASDNKCRKFEKEFKKLIKKKELADKIIYLNLSNENKDQFIEEFNTKYNDKKTKLTTNLPAIVILENGKVKQLLQSKGNENLSITKVKQLLELNEIGE